MTCDNNFQTWTIGSHTQFNLDANTYLGVDVVREVLETGLSTACLPTMATARKAHQAGPRTVSNQSAWMAELPRAPQLLSLIA